MGNREIERRFLPNDFMGFISVAGFSFAEDIKRINIEQHYIINDPGNKELRIRRVIDLDHPDAEPKYTMTPKFGAGLVRKAPDKDFEITEEMFRWLLQFAGGDFVNKVRYVLPLNGLKVEVDIYKDNLSPHVKIEVEFDSEESAKDFKPPPWFGKEITEDNRFNDGMLSKNGLPKEALIQSVPEFDLQDGKKSLLERVEVAVESANPSSPIVVLVAGGSASGKTSQVAKFLKDGLGDYAKLISMDDYYRGVSWMKEQEEIGNTLHFDQPEALDLNLLQEHISQLKAGSAIQKPVYSFDSGEREDETETVRPAPVIIVEGLFALHKTLRQLGNIKVFVDVGAHGRMLRRILRDVERAPWSTADSLAYMAKVVEPAHEEYIETTKCFADIIIRNEYNPKKEAHRAGLHELQVKFNGTVDSKVFDRSRATFVDRSESVLDVYYDPRGEDLSRSGEMIRIRESGDSFVFTYKGPLVPSEARKRPVVGGLKIDAETRDLLVERFSLDVEITKDFREVYLVQGVVVVLDKGVKRRGLNGNEDVLGDFVELQAHAESVDKNLLKAVAEELGLNWSERIKESYVEMKE